MRDIQPGRDRDDDSAPQRPREKKIKRGPRALGVVEFLPGGGTRLVPVALWIDGRYYDASLYGASPEPMALEPGTVYEAQDYGEPSGTFVVNTPRQLNGNWIADGNWKPHLALDAKLAADAAKQPKPKNKESKAIFTGGHDEGPPVLRRPGSSGQAKDEPSASTSQTKSQPTPPKEDASTKPDPPKQTASSQGGRPTLGPDNDTPAPASSGSTSGGASEPADAHSSGSSDDPDRPTLKKSTPSPPASPAAADASPGSAAEGDASYRSDQSDPDRPVLSRGKPAPAPTSKPSTEAGASALKPATPVGKPLPDAPPTRAYVAVSDAGQYETRSMLYTLTPEERQQKAPAMLALAMKDIRTFAAQHSGPPIAATAAITDYDLRIYDLDFSNTPTEVVTAKLPVAGKGSTKPITYYVTVTARLDINGEPQKIFSAVSDSNHLDAYPRLELIDAIDADANGRGDLLFRQYSDTGVSYALYRVFPYQMEKVFEGGSSL